MLVPVVNSNKDFAWMTVAQLIDLCRNLLKKALDQFRFHWLGLRCTNESLRHHLCLVETGCVGWCRPRSIEKFLSSDLSLRFWRLSGLQSARPKHS